MVQPLGGLVGFVNSDPEATASQRHGGTADPAHNSLGEVADPYPWEVFPGETHGPYGPENEYIGMEDVNHYITPADEVYDDPTMDQTPVRGHAAPWPKGVPQSPDPDSQQAWRDQSDDIHASNMGGSREMLYEPTLSPVQDEWNLIDETDPGLLFPQMEPIPGQIMTGGSGGFGSRDRVQSMARQNEYGFDSAHIRRRYASGSIPGNYMWLEPGARPLVKSIAGRATIPVGDSSPFAGQDPGESYDSQGSTLLVLPAEYQAPPDPSLGASYPSYEAPQVDLW